MTDLLFRKSTAYHEAGHVVVAAVLGRPLSRYGIHIDSAGYGIAYYEQRKPNYSFKRPASGSKADTIIAALAGFIAQRKFDRHCSSGFAEGDQRFIEEVLEQPDEDDPADLASEKAQRCLKEKSTQLVNDHWDAITEIADTLWNSPITARRKDEPSPGWSLSRTEKRVEGDRLQEILQRYGVSASIWDHRAWNSIQD